VWKSRGNPFGILAHGPSPTLLYATVVDTKKMNAYHVKFRARNKRHIRSRVITYELTHHRTCFSINRAIESTSCFSGRSLTSVCSRVSASCHSDIYTMTRNITQHPLFDCYQSSFSVLHVSKHMPVANVMQAN